MATTTITVIEGPAMWDTISGLHGDKVVEFVLLPITEQPQRRVKVRTNLTGFDLASPPHESKVYYLRGDSSDHRLIELLKQLGWIDPCISWRKVYFEITDYTPTSSPREGKFVVLNYAY